MVCVSANAQTAMPGDRPPAPPAPTVPAPDTKSPVIPPEDSDVSGTVTVKTTSEQTWEQIRDYTYTERVAFMEGLKVIEEQMEKSVAALKEKRPGFTGDPAAWDAEMKRLDDARIFLQSKATELAKATAVNWVDRRDRVATAWERMQAAHARASALVTP